MAITATASNNGSANVTTSVVTLPASVASGDLLLILIAGDLGAGAMTFPAGWTKLADTADSAHTTAIAWLKAAGGETSVNVTHTSERTNQIAWRIPAAEWHGTSAPEIATIVTGSSSVPNPGSLTPSWGSDATLWLAACSWDDSATPTLSTYPTNYANAQANSVAGSSAARCAGAWRTLTAASEDPGAFGLSGTETWQAWTIAVRPPVAAGNVTATPGTASLALAAQTPTVTATDNKVATPGVASLVISPQAPSVNVGVNVVPGVATLALTALAPTVTATANQTATIGVASLVLSPKTPTVTATDNKVATPGVASLAITALAPTVTATANIVATPGVASLALTAFAPTVTANAGITVTVGTAALAISAFAPTVTASGGAVVGDASASVELVHVAIASVGYVAEAVATVTLLHHATASVS